MAAIKRQSLESGPVTGPVVRIELLDEVVEHRVELSDVSVDCWL